MVTKRGTDGTSLSSASQPSIVAMMLEQLEVEPGHRVLEIGAGTGYNAALLRELVGQDGEVTTIDIDSEVVEDAKKGLATAGYTDMRVICGDGALGDKSRAPYDRIIVTTGTWDVFSAWWQQLTEGGRIVVPLRWRGLTRSITFDRHPGRMVSRFTTLCGFIPMCGPGGEGECTLLLAEGDVTLYYDEDQQVAPDALHGVFGQPRSESWSGVTVGGYDPFDGVWLRLATVEPGTCRIAAQPSAVDSGLATPAIPARSPALVEGASLAYFTLRPHADVDSNGGRRFELGAIGHGPGGGDLAHRIAEQIRVWDRDRSTQPFITAYPADTPDEQLAEGLVIDKRHTRLAFSWP